MTPTIQHHLTPEILMAYSAGTLPEAFSLVVATHLSLCDACRAEAESYDALGGCLLSEQGNATLDEDSLAKTMRLIEAGDALTRKVANRAPGVLPAPLQDYVGGDLEAVRWRPIGMGVKQAILSTSKEASARLLHIPAGCAVPDHGHRGLELTLVLQGAFCDDEGRFARGDVEVATEAVEHTPIADIAEDCICLAATDAPLKFNSMMPRIAQRFLRI